VMITNFSFGEHRGRIVLSIEYCRSDFVDAFAYNTICYRQVSEPLAYPGKFIQFTLHLPVSFSFGVIALGQTSV